MNFRQKLTVAIMLWLTLLAFASYHEGTGSTAWLQFLSVLSIFFFLFVFDVSFTDESSFLFDPDADNWRRKVVRVWSYCMAKLLPVSGVFPFSRLAYEVQQANTSCYFDRCVTSVWLRLGGDVQLRPSIRLSHVYAFRNHDVCNY